MCFLDLGLDERKGPTTLKKSLVDAPGLHLDIKWFLMATCLMDVTIFLCDLYISDFSLFDLSFLCLFLSMPFYIFVFKD